MGLFWDLLQQSQISEHRDRAESLETRLARLISACSAYSAAKSMQEPFVGIGGLNETRSCVKLENAL